MADEPTRDEALAGYLAAMDQAGGGVYTEDFREGFRHALAMLAAYETPAEPAQVRPEVREAARLALSRRQDLPPAATKHEHDGSGCIECTCNAAPWSADDCTCPGGFS